MGQLRKISILILIVALIICLLSCGNKDNPNDDNNLPSDNVEETCSVTLRAGGSIYKRLEVKKGETIDFPDDPVSRNKKEYFAGWYLEDELFDRSTPVLEDISLTAFFTDKYVVTFLDENGDEIASTNVKYDWNIPVSSVPEVTTTKEHYHFKGWEYLGQVISTKTLTEMKVNAQITAKAVFVKDSYQVRFYNQSSGETLSVLHVNYGDTITPYAHSYGTIESFKVASDDYDFSLPVTKDLNIACSLKRDIVNITFKTANGTIVATKKAYKGTNLSLPISATEVYSCNPNDLLCITADKEILVEVNPITAYTKGFEPNMKTDIVDLSVSFSKAGDVYFLHTPGQYFSYKGYFANNFEFYAVAGGKYGDEKIESTFGVYCDGILVNTIRFGSFNLPQTTEGMPVTAYAVPAGEHTIRIELLSTTYDPNFLPIDGNPNDYGIGVQRVVTTQDLSKIFYTVKFENHFEDSVFTPEQIGMISTQNIRYGEVPVPPTLPLELSSEEEFFGWWDDAELFSLTSESKTFADTTWHVRYKMQKPTMLYLRTKQLETSFVLQLHFGEPMPNYLRVLFTITK